MGKPIISLVIPLHNEEKVIDLLLERSVKSLEGITREFEIICIDDGSTDQGLQKLFAHHQHEPRIKIIVLSRKFGHQAAYTAGLAHATGEYVAMMDGDLQDPPELLKQMYEKLTNEKLDAVYGKRIAREESFPKRFVLKLFHRVFHDFAKFQPNEDVGNFAIFNSSIHRSLLSLSEKTRYLPGLRFFIGFKQHYVEYERAERPVGSSKMSTRALFRLAFDALFSFSDFPIKLCIAAGLLGVLVFLGGLAYTVISKLTGIAPLGWSSILISIYFWGSVQLLFLGIIGEYISRVYKEVQGRPLYIVKEVIE